MTGWFVSACSSAMGLRPAYGIVVDYDVLPGAATKEGVAACTETGQFLFSPSMLHERTSIRGSSGGTNGYGGSTVPQWVQVTWRVGNYGFDGNRAGWKGGVIVGDYRVEVAGRIPRAVLEYAAAVRGRAVRLLFRLKDDGVLFAWDVQEPPDGRGWTYSMHGGDFEDAKVFNGRLIEPGWYLAPDGRKVPIDR